MTRRRPYSAPAEPLVILVADADGEHRDAIGAYLRRRDFEVAEAADEAALTAALQGGAPDLVLLDLTLPAAGGLSVCRRLAATRGPPVIMMNRFPDQADRIVALELGADDYLEHPFSPRELVARIRAVLRRCPDRRAGLEPAGDLYLLDDLIFEPREHRLRRPDGAMIGLSDSEAALLGLLIARPHAFVGREVLARSLGGRGDAQRRIDSVVTRLRRKLETHGAGGLIRTVRGGGYGLNCTIARW
ncbi:MAG: DNA-binding response regulator [Caulobacter sp.]|nr:DNA-binding response regulator [Caulobacter sp.]